MDFHPVSKVLYFSENQPDWMSEDTPEDKLNRLLHPGKDFFGFPYCHQGNLADPQLGWGHNCLKEVTQPIALLGVHTGARGRRHSSGDRVKYAEFARKEMNLYSILALIRVS
jgi:glucose/arabinose dehydrogenase